MIARQFSNPLVRVLFGLTVVTGVVDAVSFLFLGRVFVANMTGNVVFIGFAVAGAPGLSAWACPTALAGFAVGSFVGGRQARVFGPERHRWLTLAITGETVLVGPCSCCRREVGTTPPSDRLSGPPEYQPTNPFETSSIDGEGCRTDVEGAGAGQAGPTRRSSNR